MSFAISFAAGVVLGCVVTGIVTERLFRLVGRFSTTGSVSPRVDTSERMTTASPEASANRALIESAVEDGAQRFLDEAARQGVHMTRKQALKDAREMLEANDGLGGVL